jgi:hypothetical protein
MPKRDLSKQLGEQRYTTQQKVEVQDPIEAVQAALQQDLPSSQDDEQERRHVSIPVSEQARTHARMQEGNHLSEETYIGKGINIDMLYDQIQQRKHLSNGSFRYRADELETMDAIFRELEDRKPGRISKNDIARMALATLCHDYQTNGEESVLAQVFKRM